MIFRSAPRRLTIDRHWARSNTRDYMKWTRVCDGVEVSEYNFMEISEVYGGPVRASSDDLDCDDCLAAMAAYRIEVTL